MASWGGPGGRAAAMWRAVFPWAYNHKGKTDGDPDPCTWVFEPDPASSVSYAPLTYPRPSNVEPAPFTPWVFPSRHPQLIGPQHPPCYSISNLDLAYLHIHEGPKVSPRQAQEQLNQRGVGSLYSQVQNGLVALDLLGGEW